MAKNKKKKGKGQFVLLSHWLLKQPAWRAMKPGPQALYVALKMQFNGSNNGAVFLSQRDATEALNVSRETVASYFRELESKGFIIKTEGHSLGINGKGRSAKWALTEESLNAALATKDFVNWKK